MDGTSSTATFTASPNTTLNGNDFKVEFIRNNCGLVLVLVLVLVSIYVITVD